MGSWLDKRVIITGGAGFLGSHLARRLVREQASVSVLDRFGVDSFPERLSDLKDVCQWHKVDLTKREGLEDILARINPTHVFHLAGRVDLSRTPEVTESCVSETVLATANLLWALEKISIASFIFSSTTAVYGHNKTPFCEDQQVEPASPYAISKVAAEHLCMMFNKWYGSPASIVRMSTVYGPHQAKARLIPSVIDSIRNNTDLDMTEGTQKRDFLYVDDAVDGFLRVALRPEARGEIINLGHSHSISLRDMVSSICGIMETKWQPSYGALSARIGEPPVSSCTGEKAQRILDWQPTVSIEDGLKRVIESSYSKAVL